MPPPELRALIDQAFGTADPTVEEHAKAVAIDELLRIVERSLDELTRPFVGQRWGDHSVSDLRQIVLHQCVKSLVDFRGKTERELHGWLAVMVENARKNLIRRAASRRPKGRTVLSTQELHDDSSAGRSIPEPQIDELSASQRLQLQEAMSQLPAIDRRILELRYELNTTIDEIAELVGRDERTIRRDLERILASLRPRLEPPR